MKSEEERLALFDAFPPPYTEDEVADRKENPMTQAEIQLQKALDNEKFLKWLGKQNPETTYNYWCNMCLIGKYLFDQDIEFKTIGEKYIMINQWNETPPIEIPSMWSKISHTQPWNYGEAYNRAIKLLA